MIHLAGTEMNLKTKAFMRLVFLSPKALVSAHDGLVEIVYQCSKQKKDSILRHERLGEPAPTESVVHVVKDTFLAATQIVEFNNVPCR